MVAAYSATFPPPEMKASKALGSSYTPVTDAAARWSASRSPSAVLAPRARSTASWGRPAAIARSASVTASAIQRP
jgi:hypothetical protein